MTGAPTDDVATTDLRAAFEAIPDGLIVVGPDGTVEWSNPAATQLLGTDLVGNPFGLPVSNRSRSAEIDVLGADGDQRVIDLRITPFERERGRAYAIGVRDVTERKAEVRALRMSEERYELAIRGANDGLWDWDIDAGTLHVSARWHAILGLPEHDAVHDVDAWFDRVHTDDVTTVTQSINAHLSGRAPLLDIEHRLRTEDGSHVWVLARGMAVFTDGGAVRAAGSLTDITSRRDLEARLRHQALHDPLTGLANRRLFLDRLNQFVARTRRHDAPFAVAVLDLDGFKQVNDTYGHDVGDQLLMSIADRLGTSVRPADTVSRFGGDEFAILWDEVSDADAAQTLAERVADAISEKVMVGNVEVRVTASVGVVLGRRDAGAATYLREADEAMFRAKRRGGGISIV